MTDRVAHALGERIKELTALHETAVLLEDDALDVRAVLAGLAALLPPAFQYPPETAARVSYGDCVATTDRFGDVPWMLTSLFESSDGAEGRIDVVYLEEKPAEVEGPFLVEERRLLDSLARMMQMALDRRLAQHAADRAQAELRTALAATAAERDRTRLLLEITNAVTSSLDLPELLGRLSRTLAETIPHHYASVTLWDAEARTLRRHALIFEEGVGLLKDGALVPADRPTPARTAFDRGETVVFRAPEIDHLGEHSRRVMAAEGLRTACCIPLQTRRGAIGTLNIASPKEDAFDGGEVYLLEQIARQLAIAIDNALAYGEIRELKDRLNEEKLYLEDEVSSRQEFRDIVGKSRLLTDVLKQIKTVAPTDATVLLLGETGTGKELLARAVHEASKRRAQTFVRVNGAALPANLVESELFGYERGAFTGATGSKVGRFELADKGTLFLDEVGDVPLEMQPKLLRALQEQEFERLGSTRTITVDVRLIAATNRDLDGMVAAGSFRSDLYYRLSVFPIVVPPLRDRPEDIAPLVMHFAQKYSREMGRDITSVPASTVQVLERWHWPGNIRELQNVVERAVILSGAGELRIPDGAFNWQHRRPPARDEHEPAPAPGGTTYRDAEREMILNALRESDGQISGPDGAAARLGLKRTTLQSKMRKLGIVRPSY